MDKLLKKGQDKVFGGGGGEWKVELSAGRRTHVTMFFVLCGKKERKKGTYVNRCTQNN